MEQNMTIDETEETPAVALNSSTGVFEFTGRSMPEDATKFYTPIQNWIKDYVKEPKPETIVKFSFEYFNTSSARKLVEILLSIEPILETGKKVKVIWNHAIDDELIESKGREIKTVVNLPFEIKAV